MRLEWYNPQGERIVPSKRMALHTETSRSRLIIYNAIIEDAGIYRCQATDASGHTEEASVVLEIYRKLDRYHAHNSTFTCRASVFCLLKRFRHEDMKCINLPH